MNINKLNEMLQIKESYQLPERLMNVLFDKEKKEELFNYLMQNEKIAEEDIFNDYFQEEGANRNQLKQDYTPATICKLLSKMVKDCNEENKKVLDICAGTGSLTIPIHQNNPNAFYEVEEISKRVLPILITNLAIRNFKAVIRERDVLKEEVYNIYKLTPSEKYSNIEKIAEEDFKEDNIKFDTVVSNPPFSIAWEQKESERTEGYTLPPKSKGDFVFILEALNRLKENGEAYVISFPGILYRENAEGKVREQLIKNNLIDTVIELPENMFRNTSIATILIKLSKNKKDNNILFIKLSDKAKKEGIYNILDDSIINKTAETVKTRKDEEGFSKNASFKEVEENGFNLGVSSYVQKERPDKIIPDYSEELRTTKIAIEEERNWIIEELKKYEEENK